ncbi:MAG TPA: N-6 DNA methylase [Pseudonocardiaceae bacterium]|nr:N-6 DNA methylase [Pseudonocardiaceae bacterium]
MGAAQADEAAAALTARAEARRVSALQTLSSGQQAHLGQFFTPERAAALIADLPRLPKAGRFRVLDPGAGSGALAAALAARVLRECPALKLEIVAVEIDPEVGHYLQATLTDLTETASATGVKVATEIVLGDYIELSTGLMTTPTALDSPFDLVIMNPPYRSWDSILYTAGRSSMRVSNVQISMPLFLLSVRQLLILAGSLSRSLHAHSRTDPISGNFAVFCSTGCHLIGYIFSSLAQLSSLTRVCSRRTSFSRYAPTRERQGDFVCKSRLHG